MGRRNKAQQQNNQPAPVELEDDANGNFQNAVMDAVVAMEASEEPQSNDDDAVLAALEAADEPAVAETETVETMETEEVEVELDAADEDAVLAELDAEEEDQTPAPAAKKTGRKAAAPKAPVVVRQFCDVADHLDPTELKARLDGITAKKVAEKAQNLVQCIETGKKLSGFTALAVRTLAANGSVSSKSLVEAFQADGKSLGTARAQAQQMTALFKSLGIAAPDANDAKTLVSADNALVKELVTLAA